MVGRPRQREIAARLAQALWVIAAPGQWTRRPQSSYATDVGGSLLTPGASCLLV